MKLKDPALPSLPAEDSPQLKIRKPQIDWLAADDGSHLGYRFWPGQSSGPVVVYLHGIEGHGQWFEGTAGRLSEAGISVYAPDRRGAGMNEQERGHLCSYKRYLQDLGITLTEIEKRHPGQPLFVLGNCWGAKAAILMAVEQPQRLAGLILTCPALKTHVDMDLRTKLQIAWCWLTGSRRVFNIPIDLKMFTDNPAYLEYVSSDPLRLTAATGTFYVETVKLRFLANQAAGKLAVPLLVLQSGKDEISSAEGTQLWFDKVPSSDKSIVTFANSAHTLDFDSRPQEYQNLLIDWIEQRSGRRQT